MVYETIPQWIFWPDNAAVIFFMVCPQIVCFFVVFLIISMLRGIYKVAEKGTWQLTVSRLSRGKALLSLKVCKKSCMKSHFLFCIKQEAVIKRGMLL